MAPAEVDQFLDFAELEESDFSHWGGSGGAVVVTGAVGIRGGVA